MTMSTTPSEGAVLDTLCALAAEIRTVFPAPVCARWADDIEQAVNDLIESQDADALHDVSGVEYCTVHDGIQIEGNSDDCDQADTNPDDECHMVALFHAVAPVAPSPDPNGGEQ